MTEISFCLNDFFRIGGWTVEKHVQAHKRDVAWLNAREQPSRRVVILTHHSPTVDARTVTHGQQDLVGVRDGPERGGVLGGGGGNVVLWAFGHTHYNFGRFRDENTGKAVYSNQRGYHLAQAAGFVEDDVVTLEGLV